MGLRTGGLIALLLVSIASADEMVGYLEPGRSIKISSAEPGIVQNVLVKEGQKVEPGDVLVQLDARVLEMEVRIAAEEYEVLARRLKKLRDLLPKKFASEDEILRAESDLRITELRKKRTEAQIERLTLRSPIEGVVTELRYDLAESVPGANSHIATVVQLDPMKVQFSLPIAQAARLRQKDEVEVAFEDFNLQRKGVVEFISPVATAVVNTVRVRVIIPQPGEGLPSGARGRLVLPGGDLHPEAAAVAPSAPPGESEAATAQPKSEL